MASPKSDRDRTLEDQPLHITGKIRHVKQAKHDEGLAVFS